MQSSRASLTLVMWPWSHITTIRCCRRSKVEGLPLQQESPRCPCRAGYRTEVVIDSEMVAGIGSDMEVVNGCAMEARIGGDLVIHSETVVGIGGERVVVIDIEMVILGW